jgi:putative membrane protein
MAQTTGPERRLHPASFVFSMGQHLKALLVPGAAVIFTAGTSGRDWELWLMVLLIPYTIAAVVRSLSYRYRFDPDEMVVRKGWIFRSERHIPYARIQNIDAVQNVFHRLLGVAEVRVETASGGEAEARMTVLPAEALAEMRRFVFAGEPSTAPAAPVTDDRTAEGDADLLLRLRPRELLLYGFIESRGAVVMAGAVGLLWEFGLFDRFLDAATGGEMARRGLLREIVRSAIGDGGPSLALVARAVVAFAALLLVLRVLSMVWAFVRLHGFTVRRAGEDLRIDYGLLTRIIGTVPLQRIQTLSISDSPLHRLFRRVSVHVDTAGGTGSSAQPTRREPVAPLIPAGHIDTLLEKLLPTVTLKEVAWLPPHPHAFRRVVFRGCVVTVVTCLLLGFLLRWWTFAAAAVLVGWTWFYAGRYISHLGWALVGDAIVFKTGWLWRRVTIARFSKIQVVTRLESPFDRRLGMATVQVDTAGTADAAHSVAIPFLPASTATGLASTLHAQAAQTAFRW